MSGVIGSFALSLAGRDRKRIFVIVDICGDDSVLLVDGMTHKIEKPKKKKLKHLRVLEWEDAETAELAISGNLTNKRAAAAVKRCLIGKEG